jgi:hypothetical protein
MKIKRGRGLGRRRSHEDLVVEGRPVDDAAVHCTHMDEIETVLWVGPIISAGIIDFERHVRSHPFWLNMGEVKYNNFRRGVLICKVSRMTE